jgi:hypothetical protein
MPCADPSDTVHAQQKEFEKVKTLLTDKQALAVKETRKRTKKAGLVFPTPGILTDAHLAVYDCNGDTQKERRHVASTIAGQNLDRPQFRKALGFEDSEVRSYIGEEILRNIRGENPLFGKNQDIYRDSLKLAARLAFPEKSVIVSDAKREFSEKTDQELMFFVKWGRWPQESDAEEMRRIAETDDENVQ